MRVGWIRVLFWVFWGWAALLLPMGAAAQVFGQLYPISRFEIEYALDLPRDIPIRELLNLEVRMRLSSLPRGGLFSVTALQHITQHLVSTFNRRGFNGVIVMVPEIEEGSGRDLRDPGDTTLTLRIWTGRVSQLTSIADGDRFGGLSIDERTDNAAHEWIRERSPVQPGGVRGLLDIGALEDFGAESSRHPGRNVEVELEAGARPGTTAVNLRIAEAKPWYVYAQYSNTGSKGTTRDRERIGFAHHQVSGRDDSLRVDYTTGNFEHTHSILASYDAPVTLDFPELRWRLRGWYSEYDSSEVGVTPGSFQGEQAAGEATLILNAFQYRELFVDIFAGARLQRIKVDNQILQDRSEVTYVIPQVGVQAERRTRTSSMFLSMNLDVGVTDEGQRGREKLGNEAPAKNFSVLRWNGSVSAYLEPLINRQGWEDPSTPGSSTLAHEVAFLFRGQHAFDNRLVPQYQQVAGGLYTVRGYDQAEIARDNMILGSAEYRLHLPRLFQPDATPPELPGMGAFRARPPYVWGRPDWDLIFRVFTDVAYVSSNQVSSAGVPGSEFDRTLWSVGGGVELQILRHLTVRFDAGRALNGVEQGGAIESRGRSKNGDTRGHVVATLLY